jgi:hypothetical protein
VEHRRALEARLSLLHVRDRETREELRERRARLRPNGLAAVRLGVRSPGRRDAAVDGLDHLEDAHLGGQAPERVATLDAALALEDARTAQAGEDLLEEVERDRARLGDLEDRDRTGRAALRQLGQREDGGAALLGDGDQRNLP